MHNAPQLNTLTHLQGSGVAEESEEVGVRESGVIRNLGHVLRAQQVLKLQGLSLGLEVLFFTQQSECKTRASIIKISS